MNTEQETAITPEQAEAEMEQARETWAEKIEAEQRARVAERKTAELGAALHAEITAKEGVLTTADTEAIQATIHGRPDAGNKRQAVYTLRSEVAFLRRAMNRFNVFEMEEARTAVLNAEAESAEAQYQFEQARSKAHDARLFGIVAQASEFNGGELQIEDGGIAAGLRQIIAMMFDKTSNARRAAQDHRAEVEQARNAYLRREHERNGQ